MRILRNLAAIAFCLVVGQARYDVTAQQSDYCTAQSDYQCSASCTAPITFPSCATICEEDCPGKVPVGQANEECGNAGFICQPSEARRRRLCTCGLKENGESCSDDPECSSGICNDQLLQCSDSESPILIDVTGNGFRLTDVASGVAFDIDADGTPERIAWTVPSQDDAWLAFDRNSNGRIDSGTELFGDSTAQPASAERNGFAALAVFDQNGDRWIDSADGIYASLLLWTDSNHDGVSQASELRGLGQAGLLRISLHLQESQRRDRYGNSYRYRTRIVTAYARDGGPFAYDVFLTVAPL